MVVGHVQLPPETLCLISTLGTQRKSPQGNQRILKCSTDAISENKQTKHQQTPGHEPNCLCFLGLLKGFVFFYYTSTDWLWERLTTLQIIPGFWAALLIQIKTSGKHFLLHCSCCLLSEAIPSKTKKIFSIPGFRMLNSIRLLSW